MKFLFFLALFCTSIFCSAQSPNSINKKNNENSKGWIYVGKGENENFDLFFKDIIQEDYETDKRTLWIKLVFPSTKVRNKKGKWIVQKSSSSVQHISIYCNDKKIAILSRLDYNYRGEITSSENLDGEVVYIAPDTVGEDIYNKVCGR